MLHAPCSGTHSHPTLLEDCPSAHDLREPNHVSVSEVHGAPSNVYQWKISESLIVILRPPESTNILKPQNIDLLQMMFLFHFGVIFRFQPLVSGRGKYSSLAFGLSILHISALDDLSFPNQKVQAFKIASDLSFILFMVSKSGGFAPVEGKVVYTHYL